MTNNRRESSNEQHRRPYPFRVRPLHLETTDSFVARTLAANFDDHLAELFLRRRASGDYPALTERNAFNALVLHKTQTSPSQFQRHTPAELHHDDGSTCKACTLGTGDQWMCRLCAHGEPVKQQPHLEQVVCPRHRIWVGSGATASTQPRVGDDYLVAERQLQRLRRLGLADPTTLWELMNCVSPMPDDVEITVLPVRPFPAAMHIWTALTTYEIARRLFDSRQTYAESYAYLSSQLGLVPGVDVHVVRRVWHYLRPTFVALRLHWLSGTPLKPASPHDFTIRGNVLAKLKLPIQPLEPFERYLLASGSEIDASNWREVLTHRFPGLTLNAIRTTYPDDRFGLCKRGHQVATYPWVQGRFSCGACVGRQVVSGENDISCTHPQSEGWFDVEANAPLRASDFTWGSGVRVVWRCPLRHSFTSDVRSFVKVMNCPYCAGRLPLAGFNTLAIRHPDLAEEWHPTRNEQSPDEILPSHYKKVWWLCPRGHEPYMARVNIRVRNGTGCRECAREQAGIRASQVITVSPEVRARYQSDLHNAPSTTDAGTSDTRRRTWICAAGHQYEKGFSHRTEGSDGCSYCTPRRLLPDFNDWSSRYPTVMQEWDEEANGMPGSQAFGTLTKRWWKCLAAGHKQHSYLHNRRQSKGCTDCRKQDRLGFGLTAKEF